MVPSMGLPKLSRLSLLNLICIALPITTATSISLFSRQDDAVCGGIANLSKCGSDLPSEFCCPQGSSCKRYDSRDVTSVLCCPDGMSCAFIQPITCDLSQFDAKLHPDNQIHISNKTEISLPKCGDKCCPLGYKCNGSKCQEDDSPPEEPPVSVPPPKPSPTSAPSSSETSDAPPVVQPQQCSFDGKSFAAGLFPGIAMGVLGTLGLIWIIKKRRELQEKNRYSGDFGHVSRTISDPIYDPAYAARTDFIRRTSGSVSAQHSPNSMTGMVKQEGGNAQGAIGMTPRIKQLWDRTPKLGFGGFSGLPANPAPVRAGNARDPYKTPTRTPNTARTASTTSSMMRTPSTAMYPQRQNTGPKYNPQPQHHPRPLTSRSQSSETIDVLMRPPSFLAPPQPPAMRENRFTQDSNNTTFTKLMERAGYEEDRREQVRNWQPSPGAAR